jgi:hypothetical protein
MYERGSIPGRGRRGIFSLSHHFQTGIRPTQPPVHWVPWAPSSGIKRPGREAGHLPPSGAEVTDTWNYTSTSPYVFMASCLIKRRAVFTLTFLPLRAVKFPL